MKKSISIFLIACIICLSSCTRSYYVVRHGEKLSSPDDPALSEEGLKRAQKLKEDLKAKNIKKIYSSDTRRTKMTAQPLADALGLQIEIYDPLNQGPFIEQLKMVKQNTLVVAHSNTIRQILNGLAEKEVLEKDLDESVYDNIYRIKKSKSGKIKVITGKY